MASKFKIWVDDNNITNVQGATTYAADSQRSSGFEANTPASSIRVNSALRQANLVACAIMELADSAGDTDLVSSVSDVQTKIYNYLNNMSSVPIQNIINGTTTVGNATNVTTNINGNAISTIFESNGTTVKKATESDKIKDSQGNTYLLVKVITTSDWNSLTNPDSNTLYFVKES